MAGDPNVAPREYRGCDVPDDFRYTWTTPAAYWWRAGVDSALWFAKNNTDKIQGA